MTKFILEVIEHKLQRYPTVGDWIVKPCEPTVIRSSRLSSLQREFCVLIHELVECYLCQMRGISDADVTAFDEAFEKARPDGDDSEPGDSPEAPYRKEHFFATTIERLVAAELGIDWADYERELNELP